MMEEEKNNVENSAEPTVDQAADPQSSVDQAADPQSSAVVPPQPDEPLSGKELRRQKKEAAAAQKAEAATRKRGIARCEAAAPPGEKRIPPGRPSGTRTGNKTALAYRGIRHACNVYCACD